MASYAEGLLVGHLGKDPELTYTPQGSAVCNFSLATSEKYKGYGDDAPRDHTTWWKVVVWGKQAENCQKYLAKGRKVMVRGTIRIEDPWQDRQGVWRVSPELNADKVIFLDSVSEGSNGGQQGGGQRYERGDHHHDQRRSGPDENERSQVRGSRGGGDALSLDPEDDEIPF